jgi:hypothetical protein
VKPARSCKALRAALKWSAAQLPSAEVGSNLPSTLPSCFSVEHSAGAPSPEVTVEAWKRLARGAVLPTLCVACFVEWLTRPAAVSHFGCTAVCFTMQYVETAKALVAGGIALGLFASACGSPPEQMQLSEGAEESQPAPQFELFTRDPALYQAALRARDRIQAAVGDPGLAIAAPDRAEQCESLQKGCGFELSLRELVYCQGDPDPALACTSQGAGGATLGVAMQADLNGDELDNRLIHELFHVITWSRAPHSVDGLFMEYSIGTERISAGTLDSVCAHFDCSRFVVEEDAKPGSAVSR